VKEELRRLEYLMLLEGRGLDREGGKGDDRGEAADIPSLASSMKSTR
jgi:hypothetical protein